jgi:hypothetical protein
MAVNLQQPHRLSSDVRGHVMSEQARQGLVARARQHRIELELESNASIARRYRDLVGRGTSPDEIAQGLRDIIRLQATNGHCPARDQRVLVEHAQAEADQEREAENDSGKARALDKIMRILDQFDPVPSSTIIATDTSLPGEHINQTSPALHVVNNHVLHDVRAAIVSEVESEDDFEDRSDERVRQ